MNENELLRKLSVALIRAGLARTLDSDYAEVIAERRANDVIIGADGEPLASSVESIVTEVVRQAAPKWRIASAKRDPFHTELRQAVEANEGAAGNILGSPRSSE